ncbi:hypothetical protein I601_1030 [Nocardioides dokdonensis FR1436]|uniref:2TM domain-containing protein n=1 Tax=Nocardioides dokdonensis FR1436 TaxID=1300347 RepID=A0A1A9GII4_9ACTN|nr:2TM domain-containing protein [Nocardioides dokdonensis]ANH37472.1 hypothetical protein I601_1030 [Nocardioides dokdonensis FR1436]
MVEEHEPAESTLRERALIQLKKRRDFQTHVLVYILVNTLLVAIWAMSSPEAFFWPVFVILGWGIPVVINWWDVYVVKEPDEATIQQMMDRLQRKG